MSVAEDFRSRNFSIYGQWTGVLCIVLCFALGIANSFVFRSNWIIILFSIICLVCSFVILFIEVPLLLRICPTSAHFDNFIRRLETNYTRAAIYFVMSVGQWLSLVTGSPTSLVAAAVVLLVAAVFYALAGVRGQAFVNSKTLGGQGVAQMIV